MWPQALKPFGDESLEKRFAYIENYAVVDSSFFCSQTQGILKYKSEKITSTFTFLKEQANEM